MLGNGAIDLLQKPGTGDSNLALWLYKPGQVIQVKIVCPVVDDGINTNNGVKEINPEWQGPRIGVNREHSIPDPGIPDSLSVLGDVTPEVGCPNLHAKFPP